MVLLVMVVIFLLSALVEFFALNPGFSDEEM